MTASATKQRLTDRVGIVPRLLACALLAILMAIACVQHWTLRFVEANGLQRAQDSLGSSMALPRLGLVEFDEVARTKFRPILERLVQSRAA